MKTFARWLLVGLLAGGVVLSLVVCLKADYLQKEVWKNEILIDKLRESLGRKEVRQRQSLVQWVYFNSERISVHEATTIVDKSLSLPHSLLLLALVEAESEFNPSVVSKAQAIGLGQINFTVHGKALVKKGIIKTRRDLFNPSVNLRASSLLLEEFLQSSNGNIERTLERYLGGKDGKYALRILRNYAHLNLLIQ